MLKTVARGSVRPRVSPRKDVAVSPARRGGRAIIVNLLGSCGRGQVNNS